MISRKVTFEIPPPGVGFTTVTEAVLAAAISEARMLARNCEAFTKVVTRAWPFHFTTEPETNPVPCTVSVNPAPPGITASGTRGRLIRGTGFAVLVGRLFTASTGTCGSCAALPTGVASVASKVMVLTKAHVLDFMVPPQVATRLKAPDTTAHSAGRQ